MDVIRKPMHEIIWTVYKRLRREVEEVEFSGSWIDRELTLWKNITLDIGPNAASEDKKLYKAMYRKGWNDALLEYQTREKGCVRDAAVHQAVSPIEHVDISRRDRC